MIVLKTSKTTCYLQFYIAIVLLSMGQEQIIQVFWTFPSIQKDLFYVGFSIPANKTQNDAE